MKTSNQELRDWFIITVIILTGFLLLIIAGAQAMRFAPNWQMSANMRSAIDPDSDFLTSRPQGFVEPVNALILTQPVWIELFQTPGATIPGRVRPTSASIIPIFPTAAPASTVVPNPTLIMTSYPTQVIGNPVVVVTSTSTALPVHAPNSPTPTKPTHPPEANLSITKHDTGDIYTAGMTLTYTIIVSNAGPDAVTDAIINDAKPAQIEEWSWVCTTQTGSASGCDPASTNAQDFSDIVELPVGSSIEYTVTALVQIGASGELQNSASIASASVKDPDSTYNIATDKDQFQAPSITTSGKIGPNKDTVIEYLTPGGTPVLLTVNPPLQVWGHPSYDLIFYEMPHGTGIAMDVIILEIGDGVNWYTILNWGDNTADTSSNLNIGDPNIGGTEDDNRPFISPPASDILVNSTGVTVNLDGLVPDGSYPFIRVTCPATGDTDGSCEVDAISIVP